MFFAKDDFEPLLKMKQTYQEIEYIVLITHYFNKCSCNGNDALALEYCMDSIT
jgi:hypothetical protein